MVVSVYQKRIIKSYGFLEHDEESIPMGKQVNIKMYITHACDNNSSKNTVHIMTSDENYIISHTIASSKIVTHL